MDNSLEARRQRRTFFSYDSSVKRLTIFALLVSALSACSRDDEGQNVWRDDYSTATNCVDGLKDAVRDKFEIQEVKYHLDMDATDASNYEIVGWMFRPGNRFECMGGALETEKGLETIWRGSVSLDDYRENEWREEYSSMQECLAGMERDVLKFANKNVKVSDALIAIDEPDYVIGSFGYMENRFVCQLKHTGTKGTFVQGELWLSEHDRPAG